MVAIQNFPSERPQPPFAFNPVHDLKSLWWIWVWVMFFYVAEEKMMLSPKQAKAF